MFFRFLHLKFGTTCYCMFLCGVFELISSHHAWSFFPFLQSGYDAAAIQAQAVAAGYQGDWQNYQYAEQYTTYPEQYLQQQTAGEFDPVSGANVMQDPYFMTQEEKDRGLGSVFKRDDLRLQQLREKDAREKDPNFISESYSECYPGYQEYNREVVDSDDEADLSKMDTGGRVSKIIY